MLNRNHVLFLVATFVSTLGIACAGGGSSQVTPTEEVQETLTPVSRVTPEDGDSARFERIVAVDESRTIDGLLLVVEGIAASSPERLFSGSELETFTEQYPDVLSIVLVQFTIENTTSGPGSVLAFVGTTALVNNEQLDADFLLSDLTSDILAGALVDMKAVFLSERFTPDKIKTVRFRLEKEFSLEGDKTFDLTATFP